MYITCQMKVQEHRSKGICIHPRGVSERCRAAETYVRLTGSFLQSLYWRQVPGSAAVNNRLQCRRPGFQSLNLGNTLEEEMATHPRILACRIPQTEEPGGLLSMVLQRVRQDRVTYTFIFRSLPGTHKKCIPWMRILSDVWKTCFLQSQWRLLVLSSP